MLVVTPPHGLHLPTVNAKELRSCRARASSTTLQQCALLLPAGTGTQSLHDLTKAVLGGAGTRWVHGQEQYVHHLHSVRMATWPAARAPKCFIMPVRDPVARLKSGLAFLLRWGWDSGSAGRVQRVPLPSRAATTFHGFVAAMRDPENADHRFVQGLYWSSVSKPAQKEPLHLDSVLGGHNFLVSQLDYLRGWDAHCRSRSGELHFMCVPATTIKSTSCSLRDHHMTHYI